MAIIHKNHTNFNNKIEFSFVIFNFLVFLDFFFHFPGIREIARALSYPITFLLVILNWRKVLATGLSNFPMLALHIVVLLSTLWSSYPASGLKFSVPLFRDYSFALYIASKFSLKVQTKLYLLVLTVLALGSLGVIIVMPQMGIHLGDTHSGAWRGLFDHKNILGRHSTFGLSLALLTMCTQKEYKTKAIAATIFLLCFILVLNSRSTTALGISLMIIAMLPAVFILKKIFHVFKDQQRSFALVTLLACLITLTFSFYTFINLENIVALSGKDLTLSGRTPLWSLLLNISQNSGKTLLGYGYHGFWQPIYPSVSLSQGWIVRHAHSGFIEIFLYLGIIGSLIFFLGFLLTWIFSIWFFIESPDFLSAWPTLSMLVITITSITNPTLLKGDEIIWFFYVTNSLSLFNIYYNNKIRKPFTKWIVGKSNKSPVNFLSKR